VLVKIRGYGSWPARVCDPTSGGEQVQSKRGANTVLLESFGDHMYVWSKPDSIVPFVDAESKVARMSSSKTQNKLLLGAYVEAIEAITGQPRQAGTARGARTAATRKTAPPARKRRRVGPAPAQQLPSASAEAAIGLIQQSQAALGGTRRTSAGQAKQPRAEAPSRDAQTGGDDDDYDDHDGSVQDGGGEPSAQEGVSSASLIPSPQQMHTEHLKLVRTIAKNLVTAIDQMLEHYGQVLAPGGGSDMQ